MSLSRLSKRLIMQPTHRIPIERETLHRSTQELQSPEHMPEPPLRQAIAYIKEHWRGFTTVRAVAKKFSLDPANLVRAFRSQEGTTVKRFVDDKRVRHVRTRLRSNKQLGYEIGYEIGFKKDYSFYQWFRRMFGKSLAKVKGDQRQRKT